MESWEQERKQIIREHKNLNATQLRGLLSARRAAREEAEEKVRAAAPSLIAALADLVGEKDITDTGMCYHCGRDYLGEENAPVEFCPADDCAGNIARAAIAKAKGQTT